ncbi:MAG: hypothetical protein AAGF31_09060 [Planctomycetota bacterium]
MEPDTLRELIAAGPVEIVMTNGRTYVLRSAETTIVSDFEIATLIDSQQGLRTAIIAIDNIATASPMSESV